MKESEMVVRWREKVGGKKVVFCRVKDTEKGKERQTDKEERRRGVEKKKVGVWC